MDNLYHFVNILAAAKTGCKSTGGLIQASGSLPQTCASNDTMATILNALFVLVGGLAVLMVAIGAFRYVRAGANETTLAEARRQIIHALVGLIVVSSAALIVNFVINNAP